MGGVAGHIKHLYDLYDVPISEFEKMFEEILAGKVILKEKLDGQNIFARVDSEGKVRLARNKSDIINGGFGLQDIETRWMDKPTVSKAFTAAYKLFSFFYEAEMVAGFDVSSAFFNREDGKIWMNCEIITKDAQNVIPYPLVEEDITGRDVEYPNRLYIHGLVGYTNDGKAFHNDIISYAEKFVMDTMLENEIYAYSYGIITKDILVNVQTPKSADDTLKQLFNNLKRDIDGYNSIGEYLFNILKNDSRFRSRFDIPVIERLFIRWVLKDKDTAPIAYFKSILSDDDVEFIKKFEDNELSSYMKAVMEPIEVAFMKIENFILENCYGFLNTGLDSISSKMTTKFIEQCNRIAHIDDYNLRRAVRIITSNNLPIFPYEGVVFKWDETTLKITGTFAPLNQVMGYGKF